MKRINLKIAFAIILVLIVSCDEPVTVVTDIVRPDGSVLRKIEMRSQKNNIAQSTCPVPMDSSWSVRDSIEIGSKKDTTWVRRAEKVFANTTEINKSYSDDTTTNGMYSRHTSFTKKFRWFNTEYRMSEIIDCRIPEGISIRKFMNDEELRYFYSPENMKYIKEHSADSIKYKALSDSIKSKSDNWTITNIVDMWVVQFSKLTEGRRGPELSLDSLRKKEDWMVRLAKEKDKQFDSLWKAGIIQRNLLGEANGDRFRTEADSALNMAVNSFLVDFKGYTMQIVMPGKLTSTNGYIDSTMNLIWPVFSDLFMTDNYEMWAESKVPNLWAWIVSGIFLVFVVTGIILRKKSRGVSGI